MTMRIPDAWPKLMSRTLAAAYLSIGEGTFDRFVAEGTLPKPVEIPIRGVRWDRQDLDAAVDRLKGVPKEEEIGWEI